MIAYVDTSTLIKLVVEEEGSDRAQLVWDRAEVLASVALVVVEGRAALAAARRGGRLTEAGLVEAKEGWATLMAGLHLVEVTDELVWDAAELAEVHALRGYDAVHLGAAMLVGAAVLSSSDEALCAAAARCGLHVANPLDG